MISKLPSAKSAPNAATVQKLKTYANLPVVVLLPLLQIVHRSRVPQRISKM